MEPREVVRAIETNLEGFLLAFCSTPSSEILRSPEYTQVLTPLPIGMFNYVLGAKLHPDVAAASVAAISRRFVDRGVPACWWIAPSTQPDHLEGLLERSGWSLSNAWRGMARELDGLDTPVEAEPDLEVGLAITEAEVCEWLSVFRRGFGASDALERALGAAWRGRPLPFALCLARRGGAAVGTALVFRTGTVAGIYCVGTLPEARRTGVATRLMQTVLDDAAGAGCRRAIVQSTEMGRSLYLRLGFTEAGRFRMLARGA